MEEELDFEFDSLFLTERKCRICGEIKDLMDGFYLTHKKTGNAMSAYSYECKKCTIRRIIKKRKIKKDDEMNYPDW
jgi:predicted nucleic acid-binding Zn ribbon protein